MDDFEPRRRQTTPWTRALCAAGIGIGWLVSAAPLHAASITDSGTPTTLPAYTGAASSLPRIAAKRPPHNRFMARNGDSNVHDDAWMTNTYWTPGPVGASPRVSSSYLGQRDCVSIAFDKHGRLVTACSNLTSRILYVLDPRTLEILAQATLPFVAPPPQQDPFTNSSGGVYFYLDNHDRAVVGAADGRVLIYAIVRQGGVLGIELAAQYDLNAALAGDRITSVLPDWQGRIWFVGRYTGVVGVLDPATGAVQSITLGEEIENSFAVDVDGVYIVTDVRMYRFAAGADDVPTIVWSDQYENVGIQKPGQFNAGSGTTPAIMNGGYVAIADNADPMNVVVYRRDATLAAGENRVVCTVPVFGAGAGDTENSLIAVGDSLIVENNYGYTLLGTSNGAVTTPGVSRVDVDADGNGCHVVWTSSERAPSCVPKVSTKTGLVYLYTKDPDPVNTTSDAWLWTALDFRTGATVWKQLAGVGLNFNNHYSGIALGPKRPYTAYLGAVGGIVALRDGE